MAKWWHLPGRRRHDEVIVWFREINRKLEIVMATAAEINAKLDRVEAVALEVKDDLQEVVDLLANATGGLTAAEAQGIADRLDAHVTSLEAIAAVVPEPEAPPEG
jgi:hypothetical protein